MSFYNFLIITSQKCAHCQNLKNSGMYSQIVTEAKKIPSINSVIEIDLPNLSKEIPNSYPKSVIPLLGTFPSFFLVTHESWERSFSANTPLDCQGYNLIVENGEVIGNKLRPDGMNTHVDICKWIKLKIEEKNEQKNQNLYHNKSGNICGSSSGASICVRKGYIRN